MTAAPTDRKRKREGNTVEYLPLYKDEAPIVDGRCRARTELSLAERMRQCSRKARYPLDYPAWCWGHATKYEQDSIHRAEPCRACNGTGRIVTR